MNLFGSKPESCTKILGSQTRIYAITGAIILKGRISTKSFTREVFNSKMIIE